MRTVLHLIDVAELIRLSRASYWGRSMHTLSSGPTRDPTDSHPPINHWSPPSGLRFLESLQRLLPVVCVVFFWVLHCYHRLWDLGALRGHDHLHVSSRYLRVNSSDTTRSGRRLSRISLTGDPPHETLDQQLAIISTVVL